MNSGRTAIVKKCAAFKRPRAREYVDYRTASGCRQLLLDSLNCPSRPRPWVFLQLPRISSQLFIIAGGQAKHCVAPLPRHKLFAYAWMLYTRAIRKHPGQHWLHGRAKVTAVWPHRRRIQCYTEYALAQAHVRDSPSRPSPPPCLLCKELMGRYHTPIGTASIVALTILW